jgi:NADH:ubiquinone oxidoreductase subunit K
MSITLAHYLVLGAILFATSVIGIFLNRKNVIVLLMAIEPLFRRYSWSGIRILYFDCGSC